MLRPFKILTKVYVPDGFFRVAFDIFAMILIVWELLQIPILLSFQDIEVDPGFDGFSTFITSFFLTDLILNFNTAYYARGHLVTNRSKIAKHYLKTWFVVGNLPKIFKICSIKFFKKISSARFLMTW